MAKSKKTLEVIPSAKRLIRSLRDIGYDFRHAVADIVDNSVAANAAHISIEMRFDGEDSWLRVADDGVGMSGTLITEAMRFGTERDYGADELGKFGLGLKTASLSQCSRFAVASRTDENVRRIEVRQWDLEHVETTNRWEIIDVPVSERRTELVEPLRTNTGTVVLWEQLDRVLGYRIPWGDRARNGFFHLAEELDLHLGMVFHRFLSGEARRRKKLTMAINATAVQPWDPFAREERATIVLPEKQFEISSDNGPGLVAFRPYILPPREKFSSPRAFERLAGPAKWNFQQGFYIYRADRMIQSGGWSYMRTSDEHTKLARVALEFRPDLDSAFDLNVSKARVNLPAGLKNQLKPQIEQLAKQARKAYTPPSRREPTSQQWPSSSQAFSARETDAVNAGSHDWADVSSDSESVRETPPTRDDAVNPTSTTLGHVQPASLGMESSSSIGDALERAAQVAGETEGLNRIRQVLRSQEPEIALNIGWS